VTIVLSDLLDRQALATPDDVALEIGGERLVYAELMGRANRVAHELRGAGAGRETFVGVPVDRSVETVVALLGVLRSGAAYVPFAADLPGERIGHIANDAQIELFAGGRRALDGMRHRGGRRLAVDGHAGSADAPPPPAPGDAAYAIFTSGSTGTPKGVVVEHRQIAGSTRARLDVFPLPCGTYLMLAPFTFDASAAGMYLTLTTGGCLLVPTEEEIIDPEALATLVARPDVTHLDGVPSLYATLAAFHPGAMAGLRCCILAGEALPTALVERHFAIAPDTPLFNEYGPTEGTVWSAVHRCRPGEGGATAPIGRPIRGVRIAVLDRDLEPVASGEQGEIHISGAGLARGYLNMPAKTAERFVPEPGAPTPGARMYRTGDLGRRNEHGDLVFDGRADAQVKVRGFRVELAEIEAALLANPSVVAAVVAAYDGELGTHIAAYVAATDALDHEELRAFVAGRLPSYMVPGSWYVLDQLPLTAHGKVDRAALPRPSDARPTVLSGEPPDEDEREHTVVRNRRGQYSLWSCDRELPDGWDWDGCSGTRAECLAGIESAWDQPVAPEVLA
jgi:amino acid adenylation domain-containing protein